MDSNGRLTSDKGDSHFEHFAVYIHRVAHHFAHSPNFGHLWITSPIFRRFRRTPQENLMIKNQGPSMLGSYMKLRSPAASPSISFDCAQLPVWPFLDVVTTEQLAFKLAFCGYVGPPSRVLWRVSVGTNVRP